MPQLVKKRRSGWAVLAVGALVASLVAVGAGPAPAAEIQVGPANTAAPSKLAEFSACVGPALESRDFSDVGADSVHLDAINCLAHYGITLGKGDGTFAPEENVSAFQMDLFMRRAATMLNADGDAVIGGLELSTPVTRAEMAQLLVNLLVAAGPDVSRNSAGVVNILGVEETTIDHFSDSRLTQPQHIDRAISVLYELGVANGTGDGTDFSPGASVTRAQMASFITRTLAHTNAQPAGLTAQASSGQVRVSLRDENLQPVGGASIDAFQIATDNIDKAILENGDCSRVNTTVVVVGTSPCTIDRLDPITNVFGNAFLGEVDPGTTVFVWTGELEERFNESVTESYTVAVEASAAAAAQAVVSASRPLALHARYGTSVTFTVQLVSDPIDHDGNPATDMQRVNVGPDAAGDTYTLTQSISPGPTFNRQLTIGEDGTATFVVALDDPNPAIPGHQADVTITLTPEDDAAGVKAPAVMPDETSVGSITSGVIGPVLHFSDASGMPAALDIVAGDQYVAQTPTGATNVVHVSVTNQYGEPVRGADFRLESTILAGGRDSATKALFPDRDDPVTSTGKSTFNPAGVVSTGLDGRARVSLVYPAAGPTARERVKAVIQVEDPDGNLIDDVVEGTTTVSWTAEATAANGAIGTDEDRHVLHVNAQAGQVVVSECAAGTDPCVPTLYRFKDSDRFEIVNYARAYGSAAYGARTQVSRNLVTFSTFVATLQSLVDGANAGSGFPRSASPGDVEAYATLGVVSYTANNLLGTTSVFELGVVALTG